MTNPHGTPIWYELITGDPDAAGVFYAKVIGWQRGETPGSTTDGSGGYQVYAAPDGQGVAGMMQIPEGAPPEPRWFSYVGVDDVDAAAAKIAAAGGSIQMPPTTMEGVGRMAMVTDPQGVPFYVMKGASPEASTAFKRMAPGHGEWNELQTSDDQAALAFYGEQFGWIKDGAMPMGPMGDYTFLSHDGGVIGAVMKVQGGKPPHWNYFFRVGGIDEAKERIEANGGAVVDGPHEVPGGDFVIYAKDPQGAAFGVVGSR
ncbi:VOC family protein [Sphingomonas sp. HF-S4]|uniref:VOC family protein n=1 Tax=Sphingomonas agrestis TaxID=3080540 RepID=A0ABU3YD04_9SPHN|nr:VOC family protein [Sphingomonas sp. HF-S4]MDV3459259.1 VOC family protein [Sphingomonas sp. HF-S4]